MSRSPTEEQPKPGASPGSIAFAAVLIALGILGIVKHDFTPVWNPVPDSLPARSALLVIASVISMASGMGLLWRRSAALASRLLLAGQLLCFLLLRLHDVVLSPTFGVFWPAFVTSMLLATAWALYIRFADDWDTRHLAFFAGDYGLRTARLLYSASTIFFGLAHFIDPQDTLVLEPRWLPWHVFWAYFFGCTFIAAGIAILIGTLARLAAALLVVQLALFTGLVWIPLVAAGSVTAFQWNETILSVTLTAAAWVLAESYCGVPWFAAARQETALPWL
jgi:uncharacterized membrane protein